MKIPEKLVYKKRVIKIKPAKDKKFCKKWDGEYNKGVIKLSIGRDRATKELTFLHEILHLIAPWMREKQVERLSNNLYEIFTTNKIFPKSRPRASASS